MCFNQRGNISTLNGSSLKFVDKFTYLGSSVSSTKTDINMWLAKAWTAINKLSVIWKSDLTDKIKHSFFLAVVVSILLYACTTWTLTKQMEKKLDGNYTRMLQAILNKSWRQCQKSSSIKDVLLWTPSHGWAKAGQPARTYIKQLCVDMRCNPEDLSEAIDDREGWRETVRDIRADCTMWWWNTPILKLLIYMNNKDDFLELF